MSMWYSLAEDGETPIPHADYFAMVRERRIPDIDSEYGRIGDWETPDGVRVSTVFLSLDHSHSIGPPVLWETMIFGFPEDHKLDQYCTRYTSARAAKRGHHWYVWLLQRQGCEGRERIS